MQKIKVKRNFLVLEQKNLFKNFFEYFFMKNTKILHKYYIKLLLSTLEAPIFRIK